MKTEPTIQELREAAKNHPSTFLAGALYVVNWYASQPMSAEHVEELYKQWCKETKRNGSVLVGGSMFEFFTWLKSTAPTVKAEGWVIPNDVTLKDIKAIRNYFGEHNKTLFEYRAWAVMNKLVHYFTPPPTPTDSKH